MWRKGMGQVQLLETCSHQAVNGSVLTLLTW